MSDFVFVTAVNCMDGRTQVPVFEWLRKKHGADYVDMVTEPGPVRLLAETDTAEAASIRHRVEISVTKHGSRLVAVVAHDDCAGNPVAPSVQLEQLRRAVERIREWFPQVAVVGLWLGSDWQVVAAVPSDSSPVSSVRR